MSPDEALTTLGSSHSGLSETEARARLLRYGLNELKARKKTPPLLVFLRQFLSPLIYVLIVAIIISVVVQHYMDAAVITGVLLLNAVIGFLQETRAEKAMETLMQMAAPRAKVRRSGVIKQIPAREIVPGDIIVLETGDKVPADARLIEVSNLKINEAALTGESMPVEKHTDTIAEAVSMVERRNMAYMGTIVSYGRATAVAVKTGMQTEIGRIASAIQEVKPEKTPLQKSISNLSRYLVIIFLSVVGLLIAAGLLRGIDQLEVFLLAVAAAVSAIPEGLPAIVTVLLSMGMRAMAHRNAIIRRLVAVETLGSATVICSDKTGTLTMNEMTVRRIYVDGKWIEITGEGYEPKGEFRYNGQSVNPASNKLLRLHLRIGALCNDALLTYEDSRYNIYGDPTEGALLVAAAKAGLSKEKLEREFPRLDEIPFQSERLYMATLHPGEAGRIVYIKGATEKLLALSKGFLTEKGVIPLTEADREHIGKANISMASVPSA